MIGDQQDVRVGFRMLPIRLGHLTLSSKSVLVTELLVLRSFCSPIIRYYVWGISEHLLLEICSLVPATSNNNHASIV